MGRPAKPSALEWIDRWLDGVASGKATMSQRNMRSIEAHGGVRTLISAAGARGVHLVRLTDDQGNEIVAASRRPFKTLC